MNWMFYVILETGYGPLYEPNTYAFLHLDIKGDRSRIGSWDGAGYAGRHQLAVF